ncbi:MAG TPA: ClpXP protease specificity-enhancing factor SspB [Rhizomicrobium sp.]|nr:ClpXP protease specificity-enhancing factor SspB [Rhizomicrobium sp.]
MAKDFIGYQGLADAALRSVVREALRKVEKQGLVGAHHFRITFKTNFPGVDIPDFLREQYPDEMMIILQHQFWGLKVREDLFEVTLSFKKVPATLTVPFAALTQFADPGVSFGLQFRGVDDDEPKPSVPGAAPTPLTPPAKPEPAAEPAAEKPEPHGEVVSLDAFRKK